MSVPTDRLLALLEAEDLVPPEQAIVIREDERPRPWWALGQRTPENFKG